MIVSRRSYLLSHSSRRTISAAERDQAKSGVDAAFRMFSALMKRARECPMPVAAPAYLPPSLYAAATREGHDMRGYAITPAIPTR